MEIEGIREMRRRLDITQKRLAKMAGVSQSLIAKIEAGSIDPAYSKAVQIMKALEGEMEGKRRQKKASDIMARGVVFARPGERLGAIMAVMKAKSVSQLPVVEGGRSIGSIIDDDFVEWFAKYGTGISGVKASEVMGDGFPVIPKSTGISAVAELLKLYKALLVGDRGKIVGIITKADMMKVMKE